MGINTWSGSFIAYIPQLTYLHYCILKLVTNFCVEMFMYEYFLIQCSFSLV